MSAPAARLSGLQTRRAEVYRQFGVASYWIVTPDRASPAITAFELARGHYREAAQASGDEMFLAVRPFPVSFTPASLLQTGPLG